MNELEKIELPKGVTRSLVLINNKVYVQYAVRVSSKNKRVSLGQFLTLEQATAAIDAFKRKSNQAAINAELAGRVEAAKVLAASMHDQVRIPV